MVTLFIAYDCLAESFASLPPLGMATGLRLKMSRWQINAVLSTGCNGNPSMTTFRSI